VSAASAPSTSRQVAGSIPACSRPRTAAAPASKVSKATVADALRAGRGRTRSHASVTTPSTPSLPRTSRSGLGPAPDPGSLRDAHTPAGVTIRIDSTRSSTWVARVERCPAARVASQPPTVDRSNDCG
jgi:hypothetical protein